MIRSKHILGFLAAGTLMVSGTALAGPITFTKSAMGDSGDLSNPRAAETAFIASLASGHVTENFEGFDAGLQATVISSPIVGDFEMVTPGYDGLCHPQCDQGLKILNTPNHPFKGRFNTTDPGQKWLDSFDAKNFTFTPKAGINAIGFYITDPNDSGGRFSFKVGDTSTDMTFENVFGGGLGSGKAFYLTFTSTHDITGLTIFHSDKDDGVGIDDVTVGQVPEPGTLALLGMGLLGAGLARRRRAA